MNKFSPQTIAVVYVVVSEKSARRNGELKYLVLYGVKVIATATPTLSSSRGIVCV